MLQIQNGYCEIDNCFNKNLGRFSYVHKFLIILQFSICLVISEVNFASAQIAQSDFSDDISAANSGQSTNAPSSTDERFVTDSGGDLDQYLFRENVAGGKLRFTIPITRYFSSLITPDSVDENGLLTKEVAKQLIDKHVMPATVQLRLRVWDVDENAGDCPEVDHIYINDKQVLQHSQPATLSGADQSWSTPSFDIPLAFVKFPVAPGGNADPPDATDNEIAIDINTLVCVPPDNSQPTSWAVQVDWGAIEIPNVPRPILFAHGWTGDTHTFDQFERFVNEDGLVSVGQVDLKRGLLPVPQTSPYLVKAIETAIIRFGVNKINIFAHSKGGLVARHALRNSQVAKKVEHLVTFGSPHHGTSWITTAAKWNCSKDAFPNQSERAACNTAAIELTVDKIRDNFNYSGCRQEGSFWNKKWVDCQPRYVNQPTVDYRSIEGGFGDVGSDSATYPWRADAIPFPKHGNVDAEFNATHIGIKENVEPYRCGISFIASQIYTNASCHVKSSVRAVSSETANQPIWLDETYQTNIEVEDTLISGTIKDIPVYIYSADVIAFNLFTKAEFVTFTLRTPDNQLVSPSTPTIRYAKGAIENGWWQQFIIEEPVEGAWLLHLSTNSLTTFYANATTQSEIKLYLTTDKTSYHFNEPVTFQAALVQSPTTSIPLLGGVMTATIILPDSTKTEMALNDNQNNGDITANDGIYTGQIDSGAQAGQYQIEIESERNLLKRKQSTSFVVTESASQLGQVVSDQAIDENSNGLYDYLQLDIKIEIATAGHYELIGSLVDVNGATIATASIATLRDNLGILQAGSNTLTLRFDGITIHKHNIDGPYTLTTVLLEDQSIGTVQIDSATNMYSTINYQAARFEGDPIRLVSVTEKAEDNNLNGLFDEINLNLAFSILSPGEYQANGRLVSISNEEIEWSSSSVNATSIGIFTITLQFDGKKIGRSQLSGPYYLHDLSIYGGNEGHSIYLDEVYATQAYSFTQFEEGYYRNFLPLVLMNDSSAVSACVPSPPGESNGLTDALLICSGQTIANSVDQVDRSDVFRVMLNENQEITISLSGVGGDADLYLYPPDVTSIEDGSQAIAFSKSNGNNELLHGTVLTKGTWYIEVYSYSGSTNYKLSVLIANDSYSLKRQPQIRNWLSQQEQTNHCILKVGSHCKR